MQNLLKIKEPTLYFKSSENMEELSDNSIQLIITSPPYGKIKDYGIEEQIGFTDSFEEYFIRLKRVWRECYRILEPQCRMIINVGDQYLRTSEYNRYRILSIAGKIIEDCTRLNFDFLGDIIWQKISTTNTTGGCSLMGSIYYPRNGLLTYDYEHILIFKKYEGKQKKIDRETKELSKISLSEWKKWYIGHWTFPGIIQKEHIAMFPEELPYRLIRMFSFIGDHVLDPFVGSGTTLKVAKALFRRGIGYEINGNFKEIIEKKISEAKIGYFKDLQFLIYQIYQKVNKTNVKLECEEQKQKGIMILSKDNEIKIIVDYMLMDLEVDQRNILISELKSKLEENTIQNYLISKNEWKDYRTYFIIINSKSENMNQIVNIYQEYIKTLNLQKKIRFIPFDLIIREEFQVSTLFE